MVFSKQRNLFLHCGRGDEMGCAQFVSSSTFSGWDSGSALPAVSSLKTMAAPNKGPPSTVGRQPAHVKQPLNNKNITCCDIKPNHCT